MPDINWYPGHMAKSRRELADQMKGIDAVIELCDARAPHSTRNPILGPLCRGKARVLVLNKADLASDAQTKEWIDYYRDQGLFAVRFTATGGKTKEILSFIEEATRPAVERMRQRGANKTVRLMVIGVPNVGKSTLINRLRGNAIVKTADRPGVTRTKQWVKVGPYLEMMDTPGMLWPKLEDQEIAKTLAYLGSIRDQIMDGEELAGDLLRRLMDLAPKPTCARFKIPEEAADLKGYELLDAAAKGRGYLLSGGRLNTERAAAVVLDEFRAGKIGRITLERP